MHSLSAGALCALVIFASLASLASAQSDALPSVDPRAYTKCAPREAPELERCTYVRENPMCGRDEAFVPYLETFYCGMGQDALTSGVVAAVCVGAFFFTLATVAERFFVPALNNISRALRLPADVAGATLLSFGNGAPDIFAQIAALSHRDVGESVALAVGAVTGAGTFITSFVFPCVVLFALARTDLSSSGAGFIKVDKWSFARDSWFYAISSAAALCFFIDGTVEAWEATGLFAFYIVYLLVLLAPGRIRTVLRRTRDQLVLSDSDESEDEWSDDEEEDALEPMLEGERAEGEDEEAGADDEDSATESDIDDIENVPIVRAVFHNAKLMMKNIEKALVAVLRLTMPELGPSARVTKWQARILPITAPLFMLAANGFLPGHIRWVGIAYGLFASCLTAFIVALCWSELSERSSIRTLLTACAFFQSILWMNTAASELVSLLSAIGKVSGISEALLGATVLAWGNSVGDFVSNTVVAREGNPNMAIAACFAGPMMNLLVGTSFGLMLHIAEHGPVSGYVMPNELILLGGALMFTLAYACVAIPFVHRWKITRKPAICMITFYAMFSVVYALTCTHCIFKTPWLGP